MKKVPIIIGIVIAVATILIAVAAILYGILYVFVLSGAIFLFNPNPPAPDITYGEFPFRLVYEIDGETKVIEDTVICEFDGFKNMGSAGNKRVWKSQLKSGKEHITLLDLRPLQEIDEYGHTVLELTFYWGNAEYYMGDNLGSEWRYAQDFTCIG